MLRIVTNLAIRAAIRPVYGAKMGLQNSKNRIISARRHIAALILVAAVLALAGCFRSSADDLYGLPEVSDEYIRLQEQVNAVLREGAEFSPPTSGPNRQSVQQKDLDGDGVNEVLAFFSYPGDSSLKIYIFEMIEDDYVVAEVIEGVGTAFESVRYVDMDGDGIVEIVVGWQLGAALKHMSIYSIKGYHGVMLAEMEYTAIAVYDMTGSGNENVVALRLPTDDSGAVAEVITLMPDGEIVRSEARLSGGIETISRILTGRLTDGVPALHIESEGKFDGGGLVTDICVYQDGTLNNITLTAPGGISEENVRTHLQSSDINNDGVIETPMPRLLKAQSETSYYAVDWYAFDSFGASRLAMTTYHSSDDWYLALPPDWRGKVSVRREDFIAGERTVIFSYIAGNDGPFEDFLRIYKLSGDMSMARARQPGRAILISEGASVYAFELVAAPDSFGLTFDEALIRESFGLIYSDWLAGTV